MDHGGNKKRRHKSVASEDIISNLPDVIKDRILCCLPIKEAVRTCLLSSKWRYTWAYMTELAFREGDFALGTGEPGVTEEFVNFVDMFLSLHNGSILKFELNARRFHLLSPGGFIHRWILMLSRNAAKEIQTRTKIWRNHNIPSYFFSCDELEYAYLQGFVFQLPPLFKGFKRLHTLQLDDFCASENNIGKLVASCPNLENLTLSRLISFSVISIHSTMLKTLTVDGMFSHLSLHVTNVTSALIRLQNDAAYIPRAGFDMDLSKFIGSFLYIKNISLLGHVLEVSSSRQFFCDVYCFTVSFWFSKPRYSSVQHRDFWPSELPKLLHGLTEINLDIDLGNLKEAQAAHSLFQSAPNLQRIELQLAYRGYAAHTSQFWGSINRGIGLFGNLDVVVLINLAGSSADLGFLKLLLEDAPILRKVQIKDYGKLDKEALKHLLKMRRASNDAEIVVI